MTLLTASTGLQLFLLLSEGLMKVLDSCAGDVLLVACGVILILLLIV